MMQFAGRLLPVVSNSSDRAQSPVGLRRFAAPMYRRQTADLLPQHASRSPEAW